ncbi:hypothetical protein [Winogradskyella poriferorum]|uniref:hypothetical protein n=1 Tax=Winogradskyella poriferorum TaxID=307627 RepID=UPI003D64F5D7
MKKILGITFILFFISCKEVVYPDGTDEKMPNSEIARRFEIINKTGNKTVYNQTKYDLQRLVQNKELLPISKLMSDKFDYSVASLDVFIIYQNLYGIELTELKTEERNLVFSYLIKASQNGIEKATTELKKYSEKELFIPELNKEFIFSEK